MTIVGSGSGGDSSPANDHLTIDLYHAGNSNESQQPDNGADDASSADVVSLPDNILCPIFENGRSYHSFKEERYPLPNDEREQEREGMIHEVMAMVCQTLHFAPLGEDVRRILDLGTGTGLWAMEMGDRFPDAEILGNDLSPIQQEWVPPNVRFEIDDVEDTWLHPHNHFDLIHSRHIGLGIRDWPRLLRQSFRHLRPGGWVEMHEIDYQPRSWDSQLEADHPAVQYWATIETGLRRLDIRQHDAVARVNKCASSPPHASFGSSTTTTSTARRPQLAHIMEAAGLINVHARQLVLPIGPWHKSAALKAIGSSWRLALLDGAEALALAPLSRGLEWSRARVELLTMQARRGFMDIERKMFMTLHIVVGRKPGG